MQTQHDPVYEGELIAPPGDRALVSAHSASPSGPDGTEENPQDHILSSRERHVLEMRAADMSYVQISFVLAVTVDTVRRVEKLALTKQRLGSTLSQHPVLKVAPETEAMYWEGVPDATQDAYNYQWARYRWWCQETGREPVAAGASEREHAEAVVVCRDFIAAHWTWTGADGVTLAGRGGQPYSPATIELALAVISIAHQRRGLASPTNHPDVRTQLRGYRDRWLNAGFKPFVAHALSLGEVYRMCRTKDFNSTTGLRDATMYRLAFDMASRNSELVNVQFSHLEFQSSKRLKLFIPKSKTDKARRGDVYSGIKADLSDEPELCTLALLRQLMEVLGRFGYTRGHIFRQGAYTGPKDDGSFAGTFYDEPMTKAAFRMSVIRAAQACGVDRDPVTGEERIVVPHSFRAGYATSAFEAGMDAASVADGGRWSKNSPIVFKYKRTADLFTHNVTDAIHRAHKHQREHPDEEE